jgi:hypothetical protein
MSWAKKGRIKAQSLAGRIGGFSALGFGMSVKLPEPERDIVKRVITALEDRRALYVDYNLEIPDDVIRSLESIRQEITAALAKCLSEEFLNHMNHL